MKIKYILETEGDDLLEEMEEMETTLPKYIEYLLSKDGQIGAGERIYQSDLCLLDLDIIGFEIEKDGEKSQYFYGKE